MNQQQEHTFQQLTQAPVGPLICRLALPCMASTLVTSLYNMADTFFVGMMKSNAATGAVGISFSLMALIQAVGFFFGHGSGNFISREMGRHDTHLAARMAVFGFFSALAGGTVICLLGQAFLTPLCRLLGATETILPHARSYLGVILLGAPWMTASLTLNNQLRFQGNAVYGMVGIVSGAAVNIVLDPILIFGLDLGVAGAAWATIISQLAGFCLLLRGTFRGGNLPIRPRLLRWDGALMCAVVQGGLPSLGRQGLGSLGAVFLNQALRQSGDAAIAAMSVVQRLSMLGASLMIGFGQGFQPLCGFSCGARLYSRIRQGFVFCVKVSTVFLLCLSLLAFCFSQDLIALFRDDPQVIAIGSRALRLQCLTFWSLGFVTLSGMLLQALARTGPATFLATARQGLVLIPLLLVLNAALGLTGIQLAQPAADLVTFLCCVPIVRRQWRQLSVPDAAPPS